MVLTQSTPMSLGSPAPGFTLTDTRNGKPVSLDDYPQQALHIIFMCNHCPYVVHILEPLVHVAETLAAQGIVTIAISANDASQYPADAPDKMAAMAARLGFEFPYCHDESQAVARAYDAVCTPDIFLFDQQHSLYYHGQFDDTRPGGGQAHGGDLLAAAEALSAGQPPPASSKPSVGCSIKWKAS